MTQDDIIELVREMEEVQAKYGLTDEQLYMAAADESRKEYFIKMYQALKELLS